jgi:hypothetical protein
MSNPQFTRGVKHVRTGQPFDSFVKETGGDDAWCYERGRLWARLAPVDMPLFIGRKLNPKAVKLLDAAFARKLIL